MRFYHPSAKFEIWSRACSIDSWQSQLCIFITQMSILIFVRVLENSSQRAYFGSCDGNSATPLADEREIGSYMEIPCALVKDLYADDHREPDSVNFDWSKLTDFKFENHRT